MRGHAAAACAVGFVFSLVLLNVPVAQGEVQIATTSFEDFFEAVTGEEIEDDAAEITVIPQDAPAVIENIVNGNWSAWSDWGSCEGICGTDERWKRTRRRTCTNPVPDGGQYCIGDDEDYKNNCSTAVECPTILVPLAFGAHCSEFSEGTQSYFAQGISKILGMCSSRVEIHTRCAHHEDTNQRRRLSATARTVMNEAVSEADVKNNHYALLVELQPDADETKALGWTDSLSPTRLEDLEAGIAAALQQNVLFHNAMVDAAGHTDAPDYWSKVFSDTKDSYVAEHMIEATSYNISQIVAVTNGLEELPASSEDYKLKSILFLSLCVGLTLFVLAVLGAVIYSEVAKMRQRDEYGMLA